MKQARAYHAMVVCPPFMIGKASSANFSSSPGPSSHQSVLIAKVLIFINHNPTADKTCKKWHKKCEIRPHRFREVVKKRLFLASLTKQVDPLPPPTLRLAFRDVCV